jgi:hypothetical protein
MSLSMAGGKGHQLFEDTATRPLANGDRNHEP